MKGLLHMIGRTIETAEIRNDGDDTLFLTFTDGTRCSVEIETDWPHDDLRLEARVLG